MSTRYASLCFVASALLLFVLSLASPANAQVDTSPPYSVMRMEGPCYLDVPVTLGNDLVNGDFELDPLKWGASGIYEVSTKSPQSGARCIKLGEGEGSIWQTVDIGDATTGRVTLSFWYKCTASLTASVGCHIQSSTGTTLVVPFSSTSSQTAWKKINVDISRFLNQTVRVLFYSSGSDLGTSTMWVDDVQIYRQTNIYTDEATTFSIISRDSESGVDYSQYHRGYDEDWKTYTTPFSLTGFADDWICIFYRSVDNSGNIEPEISTHVVRDTLPPTSTLVTYGATYQTGGTEKVTNGGFESGTTGWTFGGPASIVTNPVHSGTKAAMITAYADGSDYGRASQDLTISAGASRVFLSYWYKSVGSSPDSRGGMSVSLKDSVTQQILAYYPFDHTQDTWSRRMWDITGLKGRNVTLTFHVQAYGGTPAVLYVDDVSVRENANATITPETNVYINAYDSVGKEASGYNIDSAGYITGYEFYIPEDGLHNILYQSVDRFAHLEPEIQTQLRVDGTGPTGSISINSGDEYTTSMVVTLSLAATDATGVQDMRIQSDSGVWASWRPFESTLSYTLTSPGEGTKTVTVEYRDLLGNVSSYSDSISYQAPVLMDIDYAKRLGDSDGVKFEGKVVTAIFPTLGYYYIQEPDRPCGIRVRASSLPALDAVVDVDGVTDTAYCEREIISTRLVTTGSTSAIQPVGMTNRTLAGGQFGRQVGVPGGSGLSSVGTLIKTTGRVVRHSVGHFYIHDGSSIADSYSTPMVLVDNPNLGGWVPPLGSYVAVTAINGMSYMTPTEPVRVLRPRGVDDVQIISLNAAFIYDLDKAEASEFEQLLDSHSVQTDLVPLAKLPDVDLSKYNVVIIGNGAQEWGDPAVVSQVVSSGKPVIAIGYGGAKFLGQVPGLDMNLGTATITSETGGYVYGGEIYQYPHKLVLSPGDTAILFKDKTDTVNVSEFDAPHEYFLRNPITATRYSLVSEDAKYYLWGFSGRPSVMTQDGLDLFVNLVFRSVLP